MQIQNAETGEEYQELSKSGKEATVLVFPNAATDLQATLAQFQIRYALNRL
ncbi:MAG: hypothetical protein NTZ46_09225 [Verrucomicrobia bacterium]|nr:hypothetical protein [Verrucomicrobiota bacterium]